jgi:hypothetical protein
MLGIPLLSLAVAAIAYVDARFLAPGFGLTVPHFGAFFVVAIINIVISIPIYLLSNAIKS